MSVRTRVDASDLARMADRMGAVPEAFRGKMRPKLRTAGEMVKAQAAANASWSSRIPAALRVRVKLSGRSMGAYVTVDRNRAPHARPFEGILRDPFRHPVFGYGNAWVAQPARPFLFPAAKAKRGEIETAGNDAVAEAFAAAGIK